MSKQQDPSSACEPRQVDCYLDLCLGWKSNRDIVDGAIDLLAEDPAPDWALALASLRPEELLDARDLIEQRLRTAGVLPDSHLLRAAIKADTAFVRTVRFSSSLVSWPYIRKARMTQTRTTTATACFLISQRAMSLASMNCGQSNISPNHHHDLQKQALSKPSKNMASGDHQRTQASSQHLKTASTSR